jgi:hypothetical protein
MQTKLPRAIEARIDNGQEAVRFENKAVLRNQNWSCFVHAWAKIANDPTIVCKGTSPSLQGSSG